MTEAQLVIKATKELKPLELLEILKARTEVFVVEQECPYQEVDNLDDNAIHVYFEKNTRVLAYTRIVTADNANTISFGRVLVRKDARKHKLGKAIVEETIKEIQKRFPDKTIQIAAQNYLRDFYQSFGFQPTSDVFLEDNISHVMMELK
ncbi:GNAT family N-acetyltransferase [Fructobacillus durionis]|uniref:ElaA protein n=1 Tax=Fructobacillus durionis TaxID=283737 RepID=A0A1I1GFL7_9LACO|nr:GNAT family N-acetyltransferase [Fructobacillus durionis]SFC10195.1 ElaA protein [Fructobacillus durionis]